MVEMVEMVEMVVVGGWQRGERPRSGPERPPKSPPHAGWFGASVWMEREGAEWPNDTHERTVPPCHRTSARTGRAQPRPSSVIPPPTPGG